MIKWSWPNSITIHPMNYFFLSVGYWSLSIRNDPIFFCSLHWRNLSLYNKITTTYFKQIRFCWKNVIKFRGKVYSNFFKFVQQLFFLSVLHINASHMKCDNVLPEPYHTKWFNLYSKSHFEHLCRAGNKLFTSQFLAPVLTMQVSFDLFYSHPSQSSTRFSQTAVSTSAGATVIPKKGQHLKLKNYSVP